MYEQIEQQQKVIKRNSVANNKEMNSCYKILCEMFLIVCKNRVQRGSAAR